MIGSERRSPRIQKSGTWDVGRGTVSAEASVNEYQRGKGHCATRIIVSQKAIKKASGPHGVSHGEQIIQGGVNLFELS